MWCAGDYQVGACGAVTAELERASPTIDTRNAMLNTNHHTHYQLENVLYAFNAVSVMDESHHKGHNNSYNG